MDPMVQPNPFKSAVETMLVLQEVDDQIRQLHRRKTALKEQMDASQALVLAAKASQEQLKKDFDEEKKKRGIYELDVKVRDEEILKHNSQLNDCKTNDAYAAKLKEIKAAKDNKRELEEKILQLMENEENMQKQFEEQSAEMQTKTVEAEEQQKKVLIEVTAFDSEESGFTDKRNEALNSLDPSHKELYERRVAHRPKVITRMVEGQVCGACSMKVPAHQVNELKKMKQFIHCQSCGVILVIADQA